MQLGRYTIERALGAGGMSQVWLARDAAGALVVLKRQLNPTDDDRLRQEGRIGLRLKHASIVQTLELFEHDGRPVLVLEYVPGASLANVRRRGKLAPEAVCRIGADVAEGLAALHGALDDAGQPAPIVHRDVSPANIIVSPDGRARLIDLGIARAPDSSLERTRTGDLRGTVRYLAPELFEGHPHDARSDLWALGVCLFESALGRPAATGPEAVILARIVRGQLFNLEPGEKVPPAIASVLARLCAPAAERMGDAVEAAWLLSQAERSLGDGRLAAAVAVYATLEPQIPDPESSKPVPVARRPGTDVGPDAFLRFAASTYCAIDDDAVFEREFRTLPATAVTPSAPSLVESGLSATAGASSLRDAPTQPEPPAPAATSDLGADMPSTALWTPEAGMIRPTPGMTPASADAWILPPPTTGSGANSRPDDVSAAGDEELGPFGVDMSSGPPVAPSAASSTLPSYGAADGAVHDAVLEDLERSTSVPWVAVLAAAGVVVLLVLIWALR